MRAWFGYLAKTFAISISLAWAVATFIPSFIDIFKGFLITIKPSNEIIVKIDGMNMSIFDFRVFTLGVLSVMVWAVVLAVYFTTVHKRMPEIPELRLPNF